MKFMRCAALICAAMFAAGCGGGSSGTSGSFVMVEFLESGQDNIPRNRVLTFRFSAPVATVQDFFERLKIQNIQTGVGQSDFSRAIGRYVVNAEVVTFTAQLPEEIDRTDAGFKANGNYHVFLKAGPDSLMSTSGDQLTQQDERLFATNEFFEDPDPSNPPRVLVDGLIARDPTTNATFNISRLDPRPVELAFLDSNDLLSSNKAVEPGAGGAPNYSTPWEFELHVTEPLDPSTVNTNTVQMFEIRNDALTGETTADPGHKGDLVNFSVPIVVEMKQEADLNGNVDFFIRVRPIQTLVDDARYRLTFSGNILGIDFRKEFIGENGLTGDGQTSVAASIVEEPGGLGYTTEFLVFDRAAISTFRTLQYLPDEDGIFPETGKTTVDEELLNSALYNPVTDPGRAVGFLSAFGTGTDGPLAITGNTPQILNTGDEANDPIGNPFVVLDLNPDDDYLGNTLPGGFVTHDSPEAFEIQLETFTIASSSTLRVIGKNPLFIRVAGIVSVAGKLDASGENGGQAGGSIASGGQAGAGGYDGGSSVQGDNTCSGRGTSCVSFNAYLNGCAAAKAGFPHSVNGEGPGRGMAGGEQYHDYSSDETNNLGSSGGGGGSHATFGGVGEDRRNVGGAPGTAGPRCSLFVNVRLSGVIGVRSQPGAIYGDRDVELVIVGGSGGGAAGATNVYNFGTNQQAGGGGGGGGGSITIIASGTIIANGGVIDATGGNGGRGNVKNGSTSPSFVWNGVAGGGGGGAGGTISLISGADIQLTGAIIDTEGGAGGVRGSAGSTTSCNACNAGGAGGDGFIFLMDADGEITGYVNGSPGDYTQQEGLVTVRPFDASRFSSISAITELFPMPAANPAYQALASTDVLGLVNPQQSIRLFVSSAKADLDQPLLPNIGSEIAGFEVALVRYVNGGTTVDITGDMSDLNPAGGQPNRDAFVRVKAIFQYDIGVEAALGPFANMNVVKVSILFNG